MTRGAKAGRMKDSGFSHGVPEREVFAEDFGARVGEARAEIEGRGKITEDSSREGKVLGLGRDETRISFGVAADESVTGMVSAYSVSDH